MSESGGLSTLLLGEPISQDDLLPYWLAGVSPLMSDDIDMGIGHGDGLVTVSIGIFRLMADGQFLPDKLIFETERTIDQLPVLGEMQYKKSRVIGNPFLENGVVEEWEAENETVKRAGYLLVGIASQALRWPNHMHRVDDAVVVLTPQADGSYVTKYFPKQNIAAENWNEALELSEITIQLCPEDRLFGMGDGEKPVVCSVA